MPCENKTISRLKGAAEVRPPGTTEDLLRSGRVQGREEAAVTGQTGSMVGRVYLAGA